MIRLCIKGNREVAQQELSKRNLAPVSEFVVESIKNNRTYWDIRYNPMHALATWFGEVTSRECEPGKGFPDGTLLFYKQLE